jgi:hypothetical protein
VVAAFDGDDGTSDAGALLPGAANRAIGLIRHLAGCFTDGRAPDLAETSEVPQFAATSGGHPPA